MTWLRLQNVSVEFALHQAPSRSLKNMLVRSATLGRVGAASEGGTIVVGALDDVSVDLRDGDRLALVGQNGAGKTTILRVMAGIYAPSRDWSRARGNVRPCLIFIPASTTRPMDTRMF